MNVAREHITKGTEEQLETKQIQMYGPPNEAVISMIQELSRTGVPLIVEPTPLAGFTRLSASSR